MAFTTIGPQSTCQVSKLLRALDSQELADVTGIGLAPGSLRNRLIETLHEPDHVQTPYGTLVQQMKIARDDDSGFEEVPVISPFALLYFVSTSCWQYGDFLQDYLGAGARLVIYFDGVSPSDGLRFEKGRDYYAVFYTWLELPTWIHSRHDVGWLTFGVIQSKLVKDKTVTCASIFKSVLLIFFSPEDIGWNMERVGVRLKCSRGDFVLRSTFGCLLADEKGIKECLSLKGASGSKPCCFCRNVVGRADFFHGHRYFVHVASTDVAKFDPRQASYRCW